MNLNNCHGFFTMHILQLMCIQTLKDMASQSSLTNQGNCLKMLINLKDSKFMSKLELFQSKLIFLRSLVSHFVKYGL